MSEEISKKIHDQHLIYLTIDFSLKQQWGQGWKNNMLYIVYYMLLYCDKIEVMQQTW